MDTTLAVPSAEMVPMYVLWVLRSPARTAVVSTVTVGSSRGSSTGRLAASQGEGQGTAQ